MNDFYVSYLWNLSNPGCYLGHHRGTEDTEVGITGAATVRRDGARLWELAATHIVPTGTLHDVVVVRGVVLLSWQSVT